MNIKELAEQAGFYKYGNHFEEIIERFAELIRQDERDKCAQDYLQNCADVVEHEVLREREACAKLCVTKLQQTPYGNVVADAIRQRGDDK